MRRLEQLTQFKKDLKLVHKRGYNLDLLDEVVSCLLADAELPRKNRNHRLAGNYKGAFECHIQPDWLLIYVLKENPPALLLVRTGTHSDLFGK